MLHEADISHQVDSSSPTAAMSDLKQNIEVPLVRLRGKQIWTPEMTRALLDCVDDAAGDDTIFINDRAAATLKVQAALQPITHPAVFSRLTQAKIFNKLEHQSKHGGRPPGGHPAFLQLGTKSVNLSKLQAGTYSKAEIDVARPRRKIKTNKPSATTNTTDIKRKRQTQIESESESESERANENEPGYEQIGRTAQRLFSMLIGDQASTKKLETQPNKRAKVSHIAGSLHREALRQTSTRRQRETPKPTSRDIVSDSQNSDGEVVGTELEARGDDEEDASYSSEHVTSASNLKTRLKVIFICETCDWEFETKRLLLTHKLRHESSGNPTNTAGNARGSMDELTSLDLGTPFERGEPVDVDFIKSTMISMQAEIFVATNLFLSSLKVDGNETITLGFNLYEDSLMELLRTVFGSPRVDQSIQSESAYSSPIPAIQRREIILAIVGCAVTEWALLPPPQGNAQDGILTEMNKLLRARSSDLQDKLMETATRQYLEKHVKPFTQRVAHVLAQDLYQLLHHFLPVASQENGSRTLSGLAEMQNNIDLGRRTTATSSMSTDTISEPSNGAPPAQADARTLSRKPLRHSTRADANAKGQSSPTSEHEHDSSQLACTRSPLANTTSPVGKGSSRWPLRPHKEPVRIFLESLQKVFAFALDLRLDMEMKGNAKYGFRFPQSGSEVDLTQMVIRNKSDNTKILHLDSDSEDQEVSPRTTGKEILVGLTPIVTRTRKGDQRGPQQQDPILISKGCVLIHDERDHMDNNVVISYRHPSLPRIVGTE